MGRPDFWDDSDAAARVSSEHASLSRRLETFDALAADLDDLEALEEMATEDESIAAELEETRGSLVARLAELEEARLFAGRYDAGDAMVTVNAGAGGTDSQDWAEMLLRTELRWAERRGMKTEMKEASEGEEAGIKSATFLARGENAYGLFSAEKGVHRLVRISPYDAASRRHTAFAGLEVAPLVEGDVDVQIDDEDLQIDTYRASGAGGQHVNKTDSAVRITHKPTGTVVQCQNERSQSANKTTAMAMLKAKLVELEEQRRREEMAREKGEAQDVAWGSQIRSYVLHPYTMVKDHRTNVEVGNAQGVLDGDLDEFVRAELLRRSGADPTDSAAQGSPARQPAAYGAHGSRRRQRPRPTFSTGVHASPCRRLVEGQCCSRERGRRLDPAPRTSPPRSRNSSGDMRELRPSRIDVVPELPVALPAPVNGSLGTPDDGGPDLHFRVEQLGRGHMIPGGERLEQGLDQLHVLLRHRLLPQPRGLERFRAVRE